MGNIFCPPNKYVPSISNTTTTTSHSTDEHIGDSKENVCVVDSMEDLAREKGLEFRMVLCSKHDAQVESPSKSTIWNCDKCVTRLFHASGVPITPKNRAQYIPDGTVFDQVSNVCQKYAQEQLVNDFQLKFITLCQEDPNQPVIQALVNETYETQMQNHHRPTLLILPGKGKSRAGILSVKHLLISGIDVGSASYPIGQALSRKWNVVCLDPNAWGVFQGRSVFDMSLDKLLLLESDDNERIAPIAILAHSASGGYIVRYLLTGNQRNRLYPRLACMAFSDSTHRLAWARKNRSLYRFLQSSKCLLIRNNHLGSEFPHIAYQQPIAGDDCEVDQWWTSRFGSLRTVWAGTTDHSLVCWMARFVVWEFFDSHIVCIT